MWGRKGGPAGGGALIQEVEQGAENRVKEKGEGADHYHHFQGHDEKNHDPTACSNLLGQRPLRSMMILQQFCNSQGQDPSSLRTPGIAISGVF